MNKSSGTPRELINEIKRRWVARALKQGFAVMFLTFLFCAATYVLLIYRYDISPLVQTAVLAVSALILLAELVPFAVLPLFRQLGDQRIALFIEEKFPELEDRLNSAVEVDTPSFRHEKDVMIDRLLDDAAQKIRMVRLATAIDLKKERILSYTAIGLLVLALLFIFSFRDELRIIASRMRFVFNPVAELQQEFITIEPGNIQVEKGESQEILVTLKKESNDDVILHYRTGSDVWRKEPMEQGIDQPRYLYRFTNIQEPVAYYVEVGDKSSPEFAISIYEYPKATQIDLRYSYPAYTGMPDRVEENTGNIRGLEGSEVTLTVWTTGTVQTGELVMSDSRRISLTPQGGGVFSGKLTIQDYETYSVALTDREDKTNKFPEEYSILPVEDEMPLIRITDPNRDVRVNPLEEVVVAASVTDDFGIAGVRLNYSVNGSDEAPIDLAEHLSPGMLEVAGSHVFFLEDLPLEAGDIISYYVEADDRFHTGTPAVTDMYFIEITPFDANYTQVNNQQDGSQQQSGQQQQGSQMVLSQQMIIAATWKLQRIRNEQTPDEFRESLDALVQAQANLMSNIEDRVNSTALSVEMVTDDEYMEIADLLRSAVDEMGAAVEMLTDAELMDALKPEQRALNNLLKADAKNKEKQVQLSRQTGQSTGQSGSSSEERMTELMDLELDISRDKYEIQQQSQAQQSQEVNDALDKVRELAQKQQELADQSRNNLQEEDSGRFLDRLQRDQEELRQQAEELSGRMRQMAQNNQQLSRQLQERMEQIAETMRQAEQDMKNGDVQQALSGQREALNDLNRLQQDLSFSLTDNARDMVEAFRQNFEQMKEQEERFGEDVRESTDEMLEAGANRPDAETVRDLVESRENIIEALRTLEDQAGVIEQQTMRENPETATDMRNIRNTIQREELERNMQDSQLFLQNGWLTYALSLEEIIRNSIARLDEQIGELEGGLPVTAEEQVARSLNETRDLRQRMEDMMAQAGWNPENSASPSDQDQQSPSDRQPGGQQEQQANADEQQQGGQAQNAGEQQQQGGQVGEQAENRQQGQPGGDGDREAAAQMQRVMDQFDQLLDRLERDYAEDPAMRETLQNARHAFNPPVTGELLDEPEFFQDNIYEALSQIETDLVGRLDELELEKKLYGARKADVPAEYKALVDKYFESIAKTE